MRYSASVLTIRRLGHNPNSANAYMCNVANSEFETLEEVVGPH
jgi:hypothetical protein